MGEAELSSSLPSASPAAALQGSPVVSELRGFMEEVETMKAERDAIESELKGLNDPSASSNMRETFLKALATDGAISGADASLTETELGRLFQPLRGQVNDSLKRQEDLLSNIQRANTQFSEQKSSGGNERETVLKNISSAYDAFMELKGNLEEGTKFYNDLTEILVKFQSKVQDFCFARRTEKEELLKDLNANIARQPASTPPRPPAYQGDQPPNKATPPARPPPPSVSTAPPPNAAPASAPPSAPGAPPAAPSAAAAAPAPYAPTPGYSPYPQAAYPTQPMPYPQYGYGAQPPQPTGYNPYAQPYPTQQPYGQQPQYPPGQYGQQAGQHATYPQQQYGQGYPPAPAGYGGYPAQPQ